MEHKKKSPNIVVRVKVHVQILPCVFRKKTGGELQCTSGTNAEFHTGRTSSVCIYFVTRKINHNCNGDKITNFIISFCTNNYKKHFTFDKEKESVNQVINLCLRIS